MHYIFLKVNRSYIEAIKQNESENEYSSLSFCPSSVYSLNVRQARLLLIRKVRVY